MKLATAARHIALLSILASCGRDAPRLERGGATPKPVRPAAGDAVSSEPPPISETPDPEAAATDLETPESEVGPDASRGGALLLVSGGFGSCADFSRVDQNYMLALMNQYGEAIKAATPDRPVRWRLSCFGRSGSDFAYATSEAPETLVRAPVERYLEFLRDEENPDTRAFIVGHSYGGWLALQLGLALPETVSIGVLAAIDPISPKTCSQLNFVRYAISQILQGPSLGRANPGCDQAPTDVSQAQRETLRDRTDDWVVWYQREFAPLHSGPIAEADANLERTGAGWLANAHNVIAGAPEVHADLERRLSK